MVNVKYANVYKEVLVVIKNLIKEDYDKIPKEYIEFLEKNSNNEYDFRYDNSKSFQEQELLDDTKYILFGLFKKFGATDRQKEQIKAFEIHYNNKLEEQKKMKYNANDIFKRGELVHNKIFSKNSIVKIEKTTIFQKIAQKIKNFFNIS